VYDRVKCTARVLLADPSDRLLLLCAADSREADAASLASARTWFTLGGGIEPGETTREAAEREVLEETGLRVEIGSAVCFGEHVLMVGGISVLHKETFFAARTNQTGLAREDWTSVERGAPKRARWWTKEELCGAQEQIFPRCLPSLWPDVLTAPNLRRIAL
jgi:8-oxo-dGTP pyrophosphatase MutT (NUDIX family)